MFNFITKKFVLLGLGWVGVAIVVIAMVDSPLLSKIHGEQVAKDIAQNMRLNRVRGYRDVPQTAVPPVSYSVVWPELPSQDIEQVTESMSTKWRTLSNSRTSEKTADAMSDAAQNAGTAVREDSVIDDKFDQIKNNFPSMEGSELLSSSESSGARRNEEILIFRNSHSVGSNLKFYSEELEKVGYQGPRHVGENGQQALLFSGPQGEVDVVIGNTKEGDSLIFVHVRKEWL